MISDSTEPHERAKGFGIIGASFGFGFVIGPAISAFTVQWGIHVPFIIAGVIALAATVLTYIILPETNKHIGQVSHAKLFDFKKLFTVLFEGLVGLTLFLSLIYSTAFGLFIFAFQPFAVKSLHQTPNTIAIIYTIFGLIGIVSQTILIPQTVKRVGEQKAMIGAFLLVTLAFLGMFVSRTIAIFVAFSMLMSVSNSFVMPLVQTLLSKETDAKSQGSILGVNSSYMSIGLIVGPVLGGILATYYIPLPFLVGCVLSLICLLVSFKLLHANFVSKESAF